MAICFMIQPFDSGKFDKRFTDVYRPSIEAADLEAYRVDYDPSVLVPIHAIEDGIKNASICLADITDNNPNVWYELGFAFASRRPVVMVCSEERIEKKYPFDIQHRTIIPYLADSPSDFELLKNKLTTSLKAIMEKSEAFRSIIESDPVVPVEGLSHLEVMTLAVIAGNSVPPNGVVGVLEVKRSIEQAGVTSMGFILGFRKLIAKNYIEINEFYDQEIGDCRDSAKITEPGWEWIEANESRFLLQRLESSDDNVPF